MRLHRGDGKLVTAREIGRADYGLEAEVVSPGLFV